MSNVDQNAAQSSGPPGFLSPAVGCSSPSSGNTEGQKHDCPAVDALLDILDLEAGWVHSSLRDKSAEDKLAIIYAHAKKALDATE